MEKLKKEVKIKGITLVALVVTIVVLIILATISINIIFGEEGIVERTKQAKQETANAQAEEEQRLDEYGNKIDNYIYGSREKTTLNWTLLSSGTGKNSENTAVTLPENYSELLIKVGGSGYSYTFYIAKEMLTDSYTEFASGYGYNYLEATAIGAIIKVKTDKIFLRSYYHYSTTDKSSTETMSIYYR